MALEPNTTARVEISTWRSNDPSYPTGVELRVYDDPSGELLARIEMDVETWWALCQGGSQKLSSFLTNHPERLGKKVHIRTVPLGGLSRTIDEATAKTTAQGLVLPGETFDVRKTNQGWEAIFRSWITTTA